MITILSKLFLILTSEKLPRYTLKAIKSGEKRLSRIVQ